MSSGRELAVLGGPTPDVLVHVGAPNIGDRARLHAMLDDALDRRWLTNDGPFVRQLEERFANQTGASHAVAVANATAGLMLLAHCLGLRGEVVLPSLTFIATAHAMAWQGLRPVFADVDPTSLTLDPASAAAASSAETAAIVGVHLWGVPCDRDGLEAVARDASAVVFYDAAHALGSHWGGQPIAARGTHVFSLHATKLCNGFEGGILTTGDADLAEALRRSRNHGFVDEDAVAGLGINAKMNEMSAAMAMVSLESYDSFAAVNRTNIVRYAGGLGAIPGLTLRQPDTTVVPAQPYVVVEVEAESYGLTRDEIRAVLRAEGVLARRYFYPGCHRSAPYDGVALRVPLPVTEQFLERVLVLPTGTATSPQVIDGICEALGIARERRDDVRARLGQVGLSP